VPTRIICRDLAWSSAAARSREADAGDHPDDPIPVAIEKPHGLLVASLRTTGRKVFAINPYAVSRYRGRHGMAGKKSDEQDAFCGIDWAEHHHDVAIVDEGGTRAAKARITNDAVGLRALLEASTMIARARSESAGNGRCAATSVRRVLAKVQVRQRSSKEQMSGPSVQLTAAAETRGPLIEGLAGSTSDQPFATPAIRRVSFCRESSPARPRLGDQLCERARTTNTTLHQPPPP
jgi:hypothetical protein